MIYNHDTLSNGGIDHENYNKTRKTARSLSVGKIGIVFTFNDSLHLKL